MNQNLIIPVGLATAVAEYLTTRPYREVVGLLEGFKQLQPIPDQTNHEVDRGNGERDGAG